MRNNQTSYKIEQYVGDYYSVLGEIEARIEREQMKNAQLRKSIQDKFLRARCNSRPRIVLFYA